MESLGGKSPDVSGLISKLPLELGFPVPGIQIPVKLSLSAKVSSDAAWEMAYEFAPGYLYQPFRKRETPPYQPPVWASTREASVP